MRPIRWATKALPSLVVNILACLGHPPSKIFNGSLDPRVSTSGELGCHDVEIFIQKPPNRTLNRQLIVTCTN